jgi:hypothetical protein
VARMHSHRPIRTGWVSACAVCGARGDTHTCPSCGIDVLFWADEQVCPNGHRLRLRYRYAGRAADFGPAHLLPVYQVRVERCHE